MHLKKLGVSALLLFPLHSYAIDIPDRSPLDTNIQTTAYSADDVVLITAYPGKASHIVLSKSETIEDVFSGFSEGWEFKTVKNNLFLKAKSVVGSATQINAEGVPVTQDVSVKPNAKQWQTNLLVVTNQRNYAFELKLGEGAAGRKNNTYRLAFSFPNEQAKLNALKAKQQKLDSLLTPKVTPKNWDYTMRVDEHSASIAPSKAFDDGVFTYITFAQHSEIPAVFIVDEAGQESIINSHIQPDSPNTIVIQRIAKEFVLRLNNAVVGVSNLAFDNPIENKHSATTLTGVKRTVRTQ